MNRTPEEQTEWEEFQRSSRMRSLALRAAELRADEFRSAPAKEPRSERLMFWAVAVVLLALLGVATACFAVEWIDCRRAGKDPGVCIARAENWPIVWLVE